MKIPTYIEPEVYFYHPDHLGSSSWITSHSGRAIQCLQYLPYGELWMDIHIVDPTRYTFSGKEKDEETGYSYFGARYYDANLSIWLSVDPMADMYPSSTPYAYCNNNPIRLVDPNGMKWEDEVDKAKSQEIKNRANEQRSGLEQQRNGLLKIENPTQKQEAEIKSLNKKIDLLTNGIDRITEMGEDNERTYHFQLIEGVEGGVRKRDDGVFDIEHNSNGMAFHEIIHIDDYRTNSVGWGFTKDGYLGLDYGAFDSRIKGNDAFNARELKAYRAQFLFDNKTLKYSNDGFQGVESYVKNYSGIKQWMITNKIWK